MNIFILHPNAKENAKMYADKHVVKMILESVQILCSVSHMKGIPAPYKLTHENHPCVKWVAQSEAHWDMLVNIVEELNNEYRYRYNKEVNHRSYDIMRGLEKPKFDRATPTGKFVAVVEEVLVTNISDTIRAYRRYYNNKFKEMKMEWKDREVPKFITI